MTERVIDQIDPAERAESGRLGTKTIKEEKRKAAEVLRRKEMDKQAKRMEDSFKTILFWCDSRHSALYATAWSWKNPIHKSKHVFRLTNKMHSLRNYATGPH